MAQMAHAEHHEQEPSEDEAVVQQGRGPAIMSTDAYVEKVVGRKVSSDLSESDAEVPRFGNKGKRKAGEVIDWASESDDVYVKFKNRKKTKREEQAAKRKRQKHKTKDAAESRQRAKENGQSAGAVEDEYEMDEDLPEYLKKRRSVFDENYEKLGNAGLKLPPRSEHYLSPLDDEDLKKLAERPDFPSSIESSREYKDVELPESGGTIPASIARYLRDYQIKGVAFLHHLFVYQKGGILGDDMGLGKTVQVAAFLTAAFGKTGDERDNLRMRAMRRTTSKPWYPRVLIICPSSIMMNWQNELTRWGWWHVGIYHGAEKRSVLLSAESGTFEIVITTYGTYREHKDEVNKIAWDCVVADECHQLKESTSQITKAMDQINCLCRIGLTGTAIQNKFEELWTLLNWTNPGRFGPLATWVSGICEPIRRGQSHNANQRQVKKGRETAKKLVENLLPQFFLRRMKNLIAHQLPKKTDRVVFCKLTDLQRSAYVRFLGSEWVQVVKYSRELCECGSGKTRGFCCHATTQDGTKWTSLAFPVITKLQSLSNHLALTIPNAAASHDAQDRSLAFLKEMVPEHWEELYRAQDSIVNLGNPEFCGKWGILKQLLKVWYSNGDKVLIFSHSVRLLEMLRSLLANTKYNVCLLSGKVTPEDRQKGVDNFNSNPNEFVYLISTKVGGVGLNITSANKVVLFDPNWNPAYDLQAQDRAYRIGQTRDVDVFRLVSAGTIEEVVYARQIYKQQQANIGYNASMERRYFKGVQKDKYQKGEIFGMDNLLSFRPDDILLRDIVNKTNIAEARFIDMIEMDMDALDDDDDNPLRADDGDEDGAMSQLAALLAGDERSPARPKPKPKTDAIQAILNSAGVEYTHENSEVVGSSKVEAQLSRRAEEIGGEFTHGEQVLFAQQAGPGQRYEYHPPEEVMIRQFCTMARTSNVGSVTDFALQVESWTQTQRRVFLEKFYRGRMERLAGLDTLVEREERHVGKTETTEQTGSEDNDEL